MVFFVLHVLSCIVGKVLRTSHAGSSQKVQDRTSERSIKLLLELMSRQLNGSLTLEGRDSKTTRVRCREKVSPKGLKRNKSPAEITFFFKRA